MILNNSKDNISSPYQVLNAKQTSIWAWCTFVVATFVVLSVLATVTIPETVKIDVHLYSLPEQGTSYFMLKAKMEDTDLKEVKASQMLQLRLADFQNSKFGYISAKIHQVTNSQNKNEKTFLIYVPNGLVTNKNINVRYVPGLKGNAVIFIRNASLIVRLLDKLRISRSLK